MVQLRFLNKDPNGNLAKFEIIGNKTLVYSRESAKPIYVFEHVPVIISTENMISSYKMKSTIGNSTNQVGFEIGYTLYRQTNKYTGYIIMCDSESNKKDCTSNYFEINL